MHKYKSRFVSFVFFPSIAHNKALMLLAVPLYCWTPFFPSLSSSNLIIFIPGFAAFLRIDLLSDLSTESMPHAFAYITFKWTFDPLMSSDLSPPSNVTSLSAPVISLNALFIQAEYCFQPVHSFLAEHRSSFSQHPLPACQVPGTQESLYIALFSVCFKYFLLHAHSKAPFPLYQLVVLYFFTTLFHSLALPKAISFPNHQIIFMHSDLWTIIEIPHFRSREAK